MKSDRVLLTFCVVAMASRESMLLKSFVRMLDSRTKQRWLFKPQQGDAEQQAVDLTFLGDEEPQAVVLPGSFSAARYLRMGVLSLDIFARLERPLRPDELENELNRMGSLLVQARATSSTTRAGKFFPSTQNRENFGQVGFGQPSSMWRPVAEGSMHSEFAPTTVFSQEFAGTAPAGLAEQVSAKTSGLLASRIASSSNNTSSININSNSNSNSNSNNINSSTAAPTAATAVETKPPEVKIAVAPGDELRLLRWPHAFLINTPPKLQLAAFLTGGSTTLSKLQVVSRQSLDACTCFVQDLHASGFVAVTPASETNNPTETSETSELNASGGSGPASGVGRTSLHFAVGNVAVGNVAVGNVAVGNLASGNFQSAPAALAGPAITKDVRAFDDACDARGAQEGRSVPAVQDQHKKPAAAGLFARIRARLGIPQAG